MTNRIYRTRGNTNRREHSTETPKKTRDARTSSDGLHRQIGNSAARSFVTGSSPFDISQSERKGIESARDEHRLNQGYRTDNQVATDIERARKGGKRLESTTREPMSVALGATLDGVRIHDNTEADRLTRRVGARAFTAGNDVFFSANEYRLNSDQGRSLIAHELAHVVADPIRERTQTVFRQESTRGEEVAEDALGNIETVKKYADAALKPFEVTLVVLEIARTQVEYDSPRYRELSEAITYWSKGLKGIAEFQESLGNLADAAGKVKNIIDFGQALRVISELDPETIRSDPKRAATAFEKLVGAAGAVGSDWLPGPLKEYMTFLEGVDKYNFFENMADVRLGYEQRLDAAMRAGDDPIQGNPTTSESKAERLERIETEKRIRTSAMNVAMQATDLGLKMSGIQLALRFDARDLSMEGSERRERYDEVEEQVRKAVAAWDAYTESDTFWANFTDDNEKAVEHLKKQVDEAYRLINALAYDDEWLSVDLLSLATEMHMVKLKVDRIYDDVAGWF